MLNEHTYVTRGKKLIQRFYHSHFYERKQEKIKIVTTINQRVDYDRGIFACIHKSTYVLGGEA